jgi:putative phage-type endonuclease
MDQGTDAWFAARLAKVTASRVADVVAKTKSGYSASRANYMAQLIAERLTGNVAESFSNAAMAWGTETEPFARAAYEAHTEAVVVEVGFVDHPSIKMTGASPDGLIGLDGMLEIKCPQTATHLTTLLSENLPRKYITQMQWQMACAGRSWCDYASFDPRLPANLSLWIKRIERDDKLISELETQVSDFLSELDEKVTALIDKFGTPGVEK